MFSVKKIITEKVEELKRKIEEMLEKGEVGIEAAEKVLTEAVSKTVTEILGAYYEQLDQTLLEKKRERKAEGLYVERRGVKRCILTQLGEVQYQRTYYRKAAGGYCCPIDEIAGVKRYERLSQGVSVALVEAARRCSYARSSMEVSGGQVSRQTVMNKVRASQPKEVFAGEQRKVSVLHIDADEDHVTLRGGKNTIVPLISGYEGIEQKGKRGICRNIFHYSRYGEKVETLWEGFLQELERRYDLSETKIYLHGDGAAWILTGQEWLPHCQFVLDRYHKNKALRQAVSRLPKKQGSQYRNLLSKALDRGDQAGFTAICNTLLQKWPEHEKSISQATAYLSNHFDAISIYSTDPEAARGGATEPHISHVLSARLSSRPMAWSKQTLQALVPVLAAGASSCCSPVPSVPPVPHLVPARRNAKTFPHKILPFSAGLPLPDSSISLPVFSSKSSRLFKTLKSLSSFPTIN